MTRYTMPARSQGALYAQRAMAKRECDDAHRWVFVHSMDPETECLVRKWLLQRLDGFYCDLQIMYTPHVRLHSAMRARTHVVLQNTPPLASLAKGDEAVTVDAHGMEPADVAKAIVKATGSNPHLSVCGWPFCLDDIDGNGGETR